MSLHEIILSLPQGSQRVNYNDRQYLLTKRCYVKGKIVKIYAFELGGNEFVSANYFVEQCLLKPCEMDSKKVEDFLINMRRDS